MWRWTLSAALDIQIRYHDEDELRRSGKSRIIILEHHDDVFQGIAGLPCMTTLPVPVPVPVPTVPCLVLTAIDSAAKEAKHRRCKGRQE